METHTLEMIDTFPAFLDYWDQCRDLPLDAQIDRWALDYLSPWPELLGMQIDDYRQQGVDWREVAREKVFPNIPDRLPAMRAAREHLLGLGLTVFDRCLDVLGIHFKAVLVIHVGIGCGAGWATRFQGLPAVLFGLENIAESGWSDREAITGLISHEIAHLAHDEWRERKKITPGSGPWWQLYQEGFAQHCGSLVLGAQAWHQVHSDSDWLQWCQRNRGWLADEFTRRVDAGEAVTPFFGSWFDLRGKQETGYFLGCEAVQWLAEACTLEEIAVLENVEMALRPILERWAGGSG